MNVADPLLDPLTCEALTDAGVAFTNGATSLAPGDSITCTGTYIVVQADLDTNGANEPNNTGPDGFFAGEAGDTGDILVGDGDIDNVATGSGTDPDGNPISDDDDKVVDLTQDPELIRQCAVSSSPGIVRGKTWWTTSDADLTTHLPDR